MNSYEVRFCEKCQVAYQEKFDEYKKRILTGHIYCFCAWEKKSIKNKT